MRGRRVSSACILDAGPVALRLDEGPGERVAEQPIHLPGDLSGEVIARRVVAAIGIRLGGCLK